MWGKSYIAKKSFENQGSKMQSLSPFPINTGYIKVMNIKNLHLTFLRLEQGF